MKAKIYSFLQIIFIVLFFVSCDKFEYERPQDLIGSWTNPEYSRNAEGKTIITYKRTKSLSSDSGGIEFLTNGSLVERKNAGWCGTPPVVYNNFPGDWNIQDDNIMINVAYWGGMEQKVWKIIGVAGSKLKVEVVSQDLINTEATDATDAKYPTTIHRLSENILLQIRNDFAARNPTIKSSINQFGFCAWGEEVISGDVSSGAFTEEEAVEAVKEFVTRNPETGVIYLDNLRFKQISRGTGNSADSWIITTESQKIDNIEVYKTEISINIQNRALFFCIGHYYPDVYIPLKFNFDIERAKSILLEKEVIHLGWAGEYSLGKVTAKHLQECTVNLIIIPLKTEEKIELHVAWEINLIPLHYIYYVDVMTGEIIQEEPTIIA